MRPYAATLIISLLLTTSTRGAEATFPYTARIAVDQVEVRCGPDWDYYPTQRLEQGDQVEVYRHEPGGWLAIRPPAGSHSWISARQVQREAKQGLGKVVVDGAVAWVGSSVVDVRQHKWQVRLEQNELVEILDESSLSVGPGFATESHYKIAPPAGSFRWIHARQASSPQAVAHRASTRTIELTDYADDAAAGTSQPRAAEETTGAVTSNKSDPPDADQAALKRQVDQLQVELAMIAARQIAQWDLADLRSRVKKLAQSTKGTALERQVRLIAHRISEFETLKRRHQRLLEDPNGDEGKDPRIERHGVSAAPEIERISWQEEIAESLDGEKPVGTSIDRMAAELEQPRFDAEGWLMPVHSTRRDAPPFALLDDQERVVCYVQPSPGLKLRRYARKHVGLFGSKRYIPDLRASLITVTRAVRRP